VFVVEESEEEAATAEGDEQTETSGSSEPTSTSTVEAAQKPPEEVDEVDEVADPGAEEDDATPEKTQLVANRVEVQTGLEDSNRVEILSGIADTSLVVTLGQHTLKSGALVKVTNAQDEIALNADLPADEALAAARAERGKGGTDGSSRRRRRH